MDGWMNAWNFKMVSLYLGSSSVHRPREHSLSTVLSVIPLKTSINGFIETYFVCMKFLENIGKLLFILFINFWLFNIITFKLWRAIICSGIITKWLQILFILSCMVRHRKHRREFMDHLKLIRICLIKRGSWNCIFSVVQKEINKRWR